MNKPPKYFVGLVYSCFFFLISFFFFPCLVAFVWLHWLRPPESLTEAFVSLQSSKGLVPLWKQFYRPGANSSSAVPGTACLGGWERLVLGGVDYVKPVGPQLQDRRSL